MARYSYISDSTDGYVFSSGTDYAATAGDGVALTAVTDSGVVGIGQSGTGGYVVREGFLKFTIDPVDPADELVTSAHLAFVGQLHMPTGADWSLEAREKDFGPALTSADWVKGADLDDLPMLADFPYIRSQRPAPLVWRGSTASMRTRVTGDPAVSLLLHSSNHRLLRQPTGNGDEYVDLSSFEGIVDQFRPRIEYYTTVKSALTYVASASVQLSDGTHVVLEMVGGVPTLKHNPSGSVYNVIGTLSVGIDVGQFSLQPGAQAFSLTRDKNDNLFVVGPAGMYLNGLAIKAFLKGSGYSWSARETFSEQTLHYDQPINQVSVTYHDVGTGWLAIQYGHTQGSRWDNQVGIASVSCATALIGYGVLTDNVQFALTYTGSSINNTGNGLDVMALSGGVGIAAQIHSDTALWETSTGCRLYRYVLDSRGFFSTKPTKAFETIFIADADGDAKAKLIPISPTRFAVLWNGWIRAFSVSGSTLVATASAYVVDAGIPSMADSDTQPMDAVYDRATGTVQVYYFDKTNSRRLMRTGFNPSTSLLDMAEIEVAAATGAAGSSNRAIRLPRGSVDERRLVIDLGNRSGAGTDTLVHVESAQLNQAPNAPVLTNPGIVSGAVANTFSWTFSDNNPADTQSAYEVEIRDQSSLVSAYDPGKVTSGARTIVLPAGTLSNVETYEWRVKTYDGADNASAWSAWQAFNTVDSGVALITSPVSDNPGGLASPRLTVEWVYTVEAPVSAESYRVRVIRTDNGDTVFDSGYIYGPLTTSYQLTGLLSDVQQRIEVLIKDTSGNISNTATRLVTPSFGAPDAPLVMAQPLEDGSGVLVTALNPTPTGDLPPAGRNDVYRALSGSDDFIKVGEVAPGAVFYDYGVTSGLSYDYRVNAVADGETPSAVVTAVSIEFNGIYIHNPTDPMTLRHFLYGGASNSEDVNSASTELRFAGRAYPIFEYGEQFSESVQVTVVVPFDDDWRESVGYMREVARSQAVHCFRDSRGRRVFGVVNGASISDEKIGSTVSLSVIRTDYIEELP